MRSPILRAIHCHKHPVLYPDRRHRIYICHHHQQYHRQRSIGDRNAAGFGIQQAGAGGALYVHAGDRYATRRGYRKYLRVYACLRDVAVNLYYQSYSLPPCHGLEQNGAYKDDGDPACSYVLSSICLLS